MTERKSPSITSRRQPKQARSNDLVNAILEAAVQVLAKEGVRRFTTTRVAERAGVSVGTMYQYYPHKQALLFAIVERQLEAIMDTMMVAAERLRGADLATVAEGLATAWLDAKTADIVSSRAIYAIAAEFDLGEHMGLAMSRMIELIGGLIATAPDGNLADVESAAFMVAALLGGSVRIVMEAGAAEGDLARLRQELPRACGAYLAAAN